MVHRDPETGQFVSGDGQHRYEGIEVATFHADFGIQAADLSGATGFAGGEGDQIEGIRILDFGDFCDRNERLKLLHAEHSLTAYINSTQTADGTVRVAAEISASPSASGGIHTIGTGDVDSSQDLAVGGATTDDTIDVLGKPLIATGHGPFSDGASGVGGGGSAGEDDAHLHYPESPVCDFFPRDELFVNANLEVWNVADAGVHGEVVGQHIYGVLED